MFLSLVQKRRSIRKYLDKPVEKEKIELLIEAALRSPSSRGFNPWEFIVVTDRDLLEKLSKAKTHGASFLKNGLHDPWIISISFPLGAILFMVFRKILENV